MQNLDVIKTAAAWSSMAGKIYAPRSDEYRQLVALLETFESRGTDTPSEEAQS